MKQWILTLGICGCVLASHAQTDSTAKTSDTIQVGNFVIVKTGKENNTSLKKEKDVSVRVIEERFKSHRRKQNILSTNWFIFDLGFTNLIDNTDYSKAQGMGYLKTAYAPAGPITQSDMTLNSGKSSNVNLWFFMQKLNITHHVLNLKYGMGLEMYNFRYDRNISYRSTPQPMVFKDSIGFRKDKLYAGYITVPLMINITPKPNVHNAFTFSAGISAGYLIDWRNKQISDQRGKQKYRGDMLLQPWRLAAITELGLGPVRLYGSYSLNALHREETGLNQVPYVVGIRFSNW